MLVKFNGIPKHTVSFEVKFAKTLFTEIVADEFVKIHTPNEAVTVYVVVAVSVATGFEIFGLLNPVVGIQL